MEEKEMVSLETLEVLCKKKPSMGKRIGQVLLHGVLFPFVASFVALILSVVLAELFMTIVYSHIWASLITFLTVSIIYYSLRKLVDLEFVGKMSGVLLAVYSVLFVAFMIVGEGNVDGTVVSMYTATCIQFCPLTLIYALMGMESEVVISVLCYFFLLMLASIWGYTMVTKEKELLLAAKHYVEEVTEVGKEELNKAGNTGWNMKKFVALVLAVTLVTGAVDVVLYKNRPQARYAGHGFDYMNGYSSTDFTYYMVYHENNKLAKLDHKPEFQIEQEEDMPILDGAEACYPLYAALAQAVYKNIADIEKNYEVDKDNYVMYAANGKVISFSNTINAFDRLVGAGTSEFDEDKYYRGVDIYFGANPSSNQMSYAKDMGVEIEVTPIGKEAFVFFVEEDNPIENLTSEQIRAIYHGDITNWKELGGKNQEIVAFQRPNNSGSQTMMEYFMGDVSLKEPLSYERVSAMMGVIHEVAQYNNEAGAMGYTFRYFLEGLNQEKGVKMLSVDGVYPTVEHVKDGTYPITVPLVVATRKDDTNPNVQKMVEFILSPDGQELVEKTGYAPL